jgi:PTS system nitrogen regulatory IIA component
MQLSELLTSSRTLCHVDVVSKKRALELASKTIAEQLDGMAAEDIFSGLINRERLGSTGIGEGVAIPHCRIPGVTTAIGLLMTLSSPMVPEDGAEEHLQTLAGLAELFNDSSTRESLRSCEDSSSLLDRVQTLCRGA